MEMTVWMKMLIKNTSFVPRVQLSVLTPAASIHVNVGSCETYNTRRRLLRTITQFYT
jgi:hypothetical protein